MAERLVEAAIKETSAVSEGRLEEKNVTLSFTAERDGKTHHYRNSIACKEPHSLGNILGAWGEVQTYSVEGERHNWGPVRAALTAAGIVFMEYQDAPKPAAIEILPELEFTSA